MLKEKKTFVNAVRISCIISVAGVLLFSFGLASCDDISTNSFFPSFITPFTVTASVRDSAIAANTFIRQEDAIKPSFTRSVLHDSDVKELVISLKTADGAIIDWKQKYPVDSASDRELEPFRLPKGLGIGQYIMVFQVFVTGSVLSVTEEPFFFLGDAEFAVNDMQSFLPNSPTSLFVQTGENILLGVEVVADERLDPYIVWLDGKDIISEGRVFESANRLLWRVPNQIGFKTIRVIVYPEPPIAGVGGIEKELSIPIAKKSKNHGFFAEKAPQFAYWYQFQGNLFDAKEKAALVSEGGGEPRWMPVVDTYGLAVGMDCYAVNADALVLSEKEQGIGQVSLRCKPVAEGVIFSGSFEPASAGSGELLLNLSFIKDSLVLSVIAGDNETLVKRLPVQEQGFASVFVNFKFDKALFLADVSLDGSGEIDADAVALSGPLSGKAVFRLGSRENVVSDVAVIGELGVALSKIEAPIPLTRKSARKNTGGGLLPGKKQGAESAQESSSVPFFMPLFENFPFLAIILPKSASAFSSKQMRVEQPQPDTEEAEQPASTEIAPPPPSALETDETLR